MEASHAQLRGYILKYLEHLVLRARAASGQAAS
jgi:hypothetical protein